MILFYPIRWLSGDQFLPVRGINYILPWTLLFLILATLIAGLARRKWLLITLAIPTLILCLSFAPLFLPRHNTPLPNDRFTFKIMSHNLYFRQDTTSILNLIRQEQPDILVLQELHPKLISIPLDDLDDLYPELYVDVVNTPEKGFVQAILSRYPLTRISAELDRGRAQKVMAETPAGPIAVWNVHLFPPFRIDPYLHDLQATALVEDIRMADYPLIVLGDLNATDQSSTYNAIGRYLHNAHWDAGWGFGFTFPAPPHIPPEWPIETGVLYRIDHIFYSHHFIAHDAQTLSTSAGSDHFPVIAILSSSK
jgi:vancomycin resistance protein VanJ